MNSAPEYAELRRVYRSRVAAEWYRQHSVQAATTYGDYVDRNATKYWPAPKAWSPLKVFKDYVKSYRNGEFGVTRKTTSGGWVTTRTYVYGGVDLSTVPLKQLDDAQFSKYAGWRALAERSRTDLAPDGKGKVWVGTHDDSRYVPTAVVTDDGKLSISATVGGGEGGWWTWWYLLVLPELFLLILAIRVRSRRRTTLLIPLLVVLLAGTAITIARRPEDAAPAAANLTPTEPRTSLVRAVAPAPVLPATGPLVYVVREPVPEPEDDGGFDSGVCLAGKIPKGGGSTDRLTQVGCGSPKARYKVIKSFPSTQDLNKCTNVRGTRYSYSEWITRNGSVINSFVYCLKPV